MIYGDDFLSFSIKPNQTKADQTRKPLLSYELALSNTLKSGHAKTLDMFISSSSGKQTHNFH